MGVDISFPQTFPGWKNEEKHISQKQKRRFFSFCERMRKLDLVYFTGNVCTF